MFDVIINFKEMFKGCFMDKNTTSNDILKETIEQTKDHEAIISMILLKIVNDSFSAGLLYHYNPHLELIKTTGHFDYNTALNYNLLSIPIFVDGNLKYTLNLISKKKVRYSKRIQDLVEILKRYID